MNYGINTEVIEHINVAMCIHIAIHNNIYIYIYIYIYVYIIYIYIYIYIY